MGIFSKLFTALRGAANEAGDSIIDTQAMRILDQEIRDSKAHLDDAKEGLTKVIAQQIGIDRDVKRLKKSLADYEGYAIQALEKGDDTLATEIADKMAEIENELEAQQSVLDGFNNSVSTLKQTVRDTDRNIKTMEREINVVKTTEKVNKANEAASARFSGTNSSLRSATDSLERVKQKQQEKSDRLSAALAMQKEASGDDLKNRMRTAGIIKGDKSGSSVLERLKAKQASKENAL